MTKYSVRKFPQTRIATIDICEIGKQKHHVTALIEMDVTKCRELIRLRNKEKGSKISFTAWLIKVIGSTIKKHDTISSFLKGKSKLMIFEDINISLVVEKEMNGQKVPIPLIIEKANEKSVEAIGLQISEARNEKFSGTEVVLQKKNGSLEKIYYRLPGFIRKLFWKYMLKHPKLSFKKMGNVAFTSIGMMGKVNGWFIPISIHPICFGIGSIIKKPVVIENEIEIREMLQMSVLIDHDVIDGAPMARFISDLTSNIENGILL